MRILVISPYPALPVLTGGAMRTFQVCRSLGEKGHAVTLLHADVLRLRRLFRPGSVPAVADPAGEFEVLTFRELVKPEIFFNPRLVMRLVRMLARKRYDRIVLEFPMQALMVVPAARLYGVPYILDEHNVETTRFADLGRPVLARFIRTLEGFANRHAEEVLCVSEPDREAIRELYGRSAKLVPNGVDTHRFNPESGSRKLKKSLGLDDSRVVLFFGNLRYPPNREAVEIINDSIAPEVWRRDRSILFLIAGVDPPRLDYGPNVRVSGPRDRIEPVVGLSDMVIVPLKRGGGTRIKILEAMACGKVVLTTPVGVEGLDVRHGRELLVAPIEDFAGIIAARAGVKPDGEMAGRARKTALKYDWSRILEAIPIGPARAGEGALH